MTERRRKPPQPPGPGGLLSLLGAQAPDVDMLHALRAWSRGQASEVQQRKAFAYVVGELCGAGRSPFTGDAEGTAFRSGAHGVGIALSALVSANIIHIPGERSPPVHEA